MLTKEIKSLQHPLIKDLIKLRKDKRFRYQKKQVLIMGKNSIEEIAKEFSLDMLIITKSFLSLPIKAKSRYLVTEDVMKKITALQEPQGIAAVLSMPPFQILENKKRILILDDIQDPGNLGTLIRTALALNWDGVIITPNTVDPYNDKALRAAKGSTFFLPLSLLTPQQIKKWIEKNKMTVYLADITGSLLEKVSCKTPLVLILSNETRGPSPWAKKLSKPITIPINQKVNSLNVAIAGGILMYQLQGPYG